MAELVRVTALADPPIRRALCAHLQREHAGDPDFRLMPELDVCGGRARVDLAALNGRFVGFEIKSARDTTRRLTDQLGWYELVFDEIVIVTAPSHLGAIRSVAPGWCGIWRADASGDEAKLTQLRRARPNPRWRPTVALRLLLLDELRALARRVDADVPRRLRHAEAVGRLAERVPPETLRVELRRTLALRAQG